MQEPEPVATSIPISLLEAYSQARITRRDIAERLSEPVSFGRLLGALHGAGLPLPRIPSDHNSPGFRIIKQLAEQAAQRG